MKKVLLLALAVISLTFASCDPENDKTDLDLTEINALIAECQTLASAATTATYPQDAIDAFNKAITDINAAVKEATAQTAITSLVTRLQDALNTFKASAVDAIKADDVIFALSFD